MDCKPENGVTSHYKVTVDGKTYEVVVEDETGKVAGISPSSDEQGETPAPAIEIKAQLPGNVYEILFAEGDRIKEGETVVILEAMKMETPVIATSSGIIDSIAVTKGQTVQSGQVLLTLNNSLQIPKDTIMCVKKRFIIIGCLLLLLFSTLSAAQAGNLSQPVSQGQALLPPISDMILNFTKSTGLFSFFSPIMGNEFKGIGQLFMIGVGLLLLYLAIQKNFEPLLLVPIGFGAILTNIPLAAMSDPGGVLYHIYSIGIKTGVFPLMIFMGVGAMTDFGPLIANPKTLLLGAAAQVGIFITLIGALVLSEFVPGIHFDLLEAASIGIIGGADGPTAIFLSSRLAPHLLGPIAVAAYSYMALVPLIQPPIMRALTTVEERKIRMKQMRHVGKIEKIIFPLSVLGLCALLLPTAAPLIGFFMFGNLMRECTVVDRLSKTAQNALINIVTILLGLGVGAQLSAHQFLNLSTLGILFLGSIAFSIGTASGILMAKLMNLFFKTKINPLIGSAGVSAVPMAARVSQKVGMEADPQNMLLMHAMGPNVAGVIGSAVAAGVLLTLKDLVM